MQIKKAPQRNLKPFNFHRNERTVIAITFLYGELRYLNDVSWRDIRVVDKSMS